MDGTSFRLSMFEPDNIGMIIQRHEIENLDSCFLFPFKKVLRDTKINQYTCFVEAMGEAADVLVTLALYRCVDSISAPVGGGRIVAKKVAGSELSVIGPVISQTQWALGAPINLIGGSYWLAVSLQTITEGGGAGTFFFFGVTDADANILYPKFSVTLASPPTLPATINLSAMARYTTDWIYASGEWQ